MLPNIFKSLFLIKAQGILQSSVYSLISWSELKIFCMTIYSSNMFYNEQKLFHQVVFCAGIPGPRWLIYNQSYITLLPPRKWTNRSFLNIEITLIYPSEYLKHTPKTGTSHDKLKWIVETHLPRWIRDHLRHNPYIPILCKDRNVGAENHEITFGSSLSTHSCQNVAMAIWVRPTAHFTCTHQRGCARTIHHCLLCLPVESLSHI